MLEEKTVVNDSVEQLAACVKQAFRFDTHVKNSNSNNNKAPTNAATVSASEDVDDDSDGEGGFDELESWLMKEDAAVNGPGAGGGGGSKLGGNGGAGLVNRLNLSVRVQNEITKSEKKGERRPNNQGRDDRATCEQVLDPRTRLILFKLLSNGFLEEIDGAFALHLLLTASEERIYLLFLRCSVFVLFFWHNVLAYVGTACAGCLSTGKEANVYYARGGFSQAGREFAVKIFKTSILVFKDRDKYVSGEHRFRNGYCRSNPRKMVRTWAEKEMRNLKRLNHAGIPAPVPHLLKSHVLVMDFLGTDGWCAPRLKDADLSLQQCVSCYQTLVMDTRRMFQVRSPVTCYL